MNNPNEMMVNYLNLVEFNVYLFGNNAISVMLYNKTSGKILEDKINTRFKDGESETSSMELVNNNPEFFNEVIQDINESFSIDSNKGIELELLLADEIVNKANEAQRIALDVKSKINIDVNNECLELDYDCFENRVNTDGEIESFYLIGLVVDNALIECEYKIKVVDGELSLYEQEDDAHIDMFLEGRVKDLKDTYPDEYDNLKYNIQETLSDFSFDMLNIDFLAERINEKFIDDNGLANEDMANEIFIENNSIEVEVDDLEIVLGIESGKALLKLLSKVKFSDNDEFTFKFDLDIDGKKIKSGASNITVNEDSIIQNTEVLGELVKSSLPHDTKDEGILDTINKKIGREVYANFQGYKEKLFNEAGLNNTNKVVSKKKSMSLELSM